MIILFALCIKLILIAKISILSKNLDCLEARLWKYAEKVAIVPPCSMPKQDNNKNCIKKIFACNKKISEF